MSSFTWWEETLLTRGVPGTHFYKGTAKIKSSEFFFSPRR